MVPRRRRRRQTTRVTRSLLALVFCLSICNKNHIAAVSRADRRAPCPPRCFLATPFRRRPAAAAFFRPRRASPPPPAPRFIQVKYRFRVASSTAPPSRWPLQKMRNESAVNLPHPLNSEGSAQSVAKKSRDMVFRAATRLACSPQGRMAAAKAPSSASSTADGVVQVSRKPAIAARTAGPPVVREQSRQHEMWAQGSVCRSWIKSRGEGPGRDTDAQRWRHQSCQPPGAMPGAARASTAGPHLLSARARQRVSSFGGTAWDDQ